MYGVQMVAPLGSPSSLSLLPLSSSKVGSIQIVLFVTMKSIACLSLVLAVVVLAASLQHADAQSPVVKVVKLLTESRLFVELTFLVAFPQ